jgi:predicted MFS family arabinose efflux permease
MDRTDADAHGERSCLGGAIIDATVTLCDTLLAAWPVTAFRKATKGPTGHAPRLPVSAMASSSLLAPFRIRSFRFQYPADLLTSWGSEMETLILGWYILAETGSVLLLTLFGSLQYFGTLVAPVFGMAGDRLGHRAVLCAMRASYAALALLLMVLAYTAVLRPLHVFVIAALAGLVRPSDLAMRSALVADTMPADRFVSAMGASRTTSDSARTVGSLAGAGLFAALGLGTAYAAITGFYIGGFLLTLGVGTARNTVNLVARNSLWRDLREGLAYLWDTPSSLAALWLAFLVNLTAYPLTSGLLPYIARDIYHVDQTGLGTLIASFAFGSLMGSVLIGIIGRSIRPARMMIVFAIAWYAMLLVFVRVNDPTSGSLTLIGAGLAQSLSLVPMSALLLHGAGAYRGRVMGMRMLAIYGLPIGLLGAGALIDRIGFAPTATLYCTVGIAITLLIALRWRAALWPLHAPANAR